MSNIGKILEENRSGKVFRSGYVTTLAFSLQFSLVINTSSSPLAPDYLVVTKNSQGHDVPVGAAWKRTIAKPGKDPMEMLSLTFDDPSFERPLNVAAFKADDGSWDISFRRRQDRQS